MRSPAHCDVLPIDTLLGPAAAASTRSSLPAIKSSKFGPAASLSAREPLLLLEDAAAVVLAPDELADEAAVARLRVRSCVCGIDGHRRSAWACIHHTEPERGRTLLVLATTERCMVYEQSYSVVSLVLKHCANHRPSCFLACQLSCRPIDATELQRLASTSITIRYKSTGL